MAPRPRLLFGITVLWIPLAFLFDGVTVLMLPLRVGGDAAQLGLVSFLGLAIAAGFQLVAGTLSDRYRERLDRRLFLASAAAPALLGLWILAGGTGLVAAVVGYVVLQLGASAMQAAQQTLIPEHVDPAARGRASGLKGAFDVGGAFLAFAVLGTILATGELSPAAIVVTGLVVAAIAFVLVLVPRTRGVPPATGSWQALTPGLVPLVVARFLFLFGTYAVGRFLVLLVAERLEIAPERAVDEAGWLLALFTLATAAAAVPVGWLADRRSRRDLMIGGAVVAAGGILLLVPPAGLPGVLAGGLVMSLGTAAFVTANWAATTAVVPAPEAGRLMAIANLGTGLAAAAAGILGPLIAGSGFAPALLLAAVASAAAVVPLLNPALQRKPARENAT
jgi:MFS family permease